MRTLLTTLFLLGGVTLSLSALELSADDPRLHYSDYASKQIVEPVRSRKIMRFDRLIPHQGNLKYDNPGTRIRFKTDAKALRLRLCYNGVPRRGVPLDSVGLLYIDGKLAENGTFTPPARKPNSDSPVDFILKLPADGVLHEYEIVLPLADSVDVRGLSVNDKAVFQEPSPRLGKCVIYGGAIVQSYASSSIENSFPFIFGRLKNWETVNMGMEKIALTPWHADFLAEIPMNTLIVMAGTRDWQIGTTLPVFKKNIERFVVEFRSKQPKTKLVFITPLFSAAVSKSGIDLEEYRKAFYEAAAELKDGNIQILDGLKLLANDASFLAPDKISLNDVGARQFAENLAKALK